jgi:hypothetical protein
VDAATLIGSRLSALRVIAWTQAALWGSTLGVAVVVRAAGFTHSAAAELAFRFPATTRSLSQVLSIAGANLRVVCVLLALGELRSLVPATVLPARGGALLLTLANSSLVGVAIGAYGVKALEWLVHLPLEWMALSLALLPLFSGPRQPGRQRTVAALAALCAVGAGGLVEVFLTPL